MKDITKLLVSNYIYLLILCNMGKHGYYLGLYK